MLATRLRRFGVSIPEGKVGPLLHPLESLGEPFTMLLAWNRTATNRKHAKCRASVRPRRPGVRFHRPWLEMLESRITPLVTITSLTTLAAFSGANGALPLSSLTEDSSGNLFGTT